MTPPEKIAEDLKKSGFASEMSALQIFSDAKWKFSPGHHYLDPNTNQSREIDIYAWLATQYWDENNKAIPSFGTTLLCDVKKTERPWILLKSASEDPYIDLDVEMTTIAGAYKNAKVKSPQKVAAAYSKGSVTLTNGWAAYGLHEAFKPPTDSSRWYSCAISLLTCADAEVNLNEASTGDTLAMHYSVYQPVIILDGELFAAAVNKDLQLDITAINAGSLRLGLRSKDMRRHQSYIDIVRLSHLKQYLDSFSERNRAGLSGYLAQRKEADRKR